MQPTPSAVGKVRGAKRRDLELEDLANGFAKLAMDLEPFPHADVREKARGAPAAGRRRPFRSVLRLVVDPQPEEPGEVGLLVAPGRVCEVGGRLLSWRSQSGMNPHSAIFSEDT